MLWCFSLSCLPLSQMQIQPYAPSPALSCLPARALPDHSHPSYHWRRSSGPPPLTLTLQCSLEHSVLLFSSSLSSLSGVHSLPTSQKPWFSQGWLICCENSDEQSSSLVCLFLVNLEMDGLPVTEASWYHRRNMNPGVIQPKVKSQLCHTQILSFGEMPCPVCVCVLVFMIVLLEGHFED